MPAPKDKESAFKKGLTSADLVDGFRSFNSKSAGLFEFVEGQTIDGTFLSRRLETITDKDTQAPKQIWVYRIATSEGLLKLGGRTMLDRMFDDIIDEMFGGDETTMRGHKIQIIRGTDVKKDKKNIGQYDIRIAAKSE